MRREDHGTGAPGGVLSDARYVSRREGREGGVGWIDVFCHRWWTRRHRRLIDRSNPLFPPPFLGLRVFTVPEAATTLWSNGVSLADVLGSEETQYWFQDTILECVFLCFSGVWSAVLMLLVELFACLFGQVGVCWCMGV